MLRVGELVGLGDQKHLEAALQRPLVLAGHKASLREVDIREVRLRGRGGRKKEERSIRKITD